MVDGIFTAGVGAVLWKDLLKFGYLIPVNWNNSYILANAEAFNKLSPDLQAKLRKAAQDAAKWNQDTMQTEEAASVKTLTDAGYTMTTAPAAEAAKVADTMKPYWDEWAKSRGPDGGRGARQSARGARPLTMRNAGDAGCRPTALPASHPEPPVGEGPVERLCKWASEAALIIMLVVIGADIFTRYLLNFSFEVADELGGYMLVVMTFVSLSVCQVNGAFHQVELVQARLTPRGRALSAAIFDVLSFGFAAILLWHFIRLEFSSYRFGERAPTYLETPLWIPRLAMAIGVAALCFAIVRTFLAHVRRFRGLAHGS